jgi:hypothetical protein
VNSVETTPRQLNWGSDQVIENLIKKILYYDCPDFVPWRIDERRIANGANP